MHGREIRGIGSRGVGHKGGMKGEEPRNGAKDGWDGIESRGGGTGWERGQSRSLQVVGCCCVLWGVVDEVAVTFIWQGRGACESRAYFHVSLLEILV